MANPASQQIIDENADPATAIYATSAQAVPATSQGNIYITNVNEYTTIRVSSPGQPAGNSTEVQFNFNGQMDGDNGLTYNPTTDSLDLLGNLTAGAVLTDSLKYANGSDWSFGSGSYANSNVASYLPTYTGNITAGNVSVTGNVTSAYIIGNGSQLTGTVANATHAVTAGTANSVAGANVTGTVSLATTATSATSATTAGTVTTAAQPNITSTGSLTGLTVSNATGVVNFTTTANVTLGNVSNLHISGGTTGQVLTTNGSGGLSWATSSGFDGANVVFISNTTVSTNYNNGALHIEGGVGVGGNVNVLGHVASDSTMYAGHLSAFGSWTAPLFVGKDAGAEYVQGALVNTDPAGSSDWVAYNDLSDGDGGGSAWADMGYTGSNFSDPLYTITNSNDGYFFVQGIDALDGGNLVLATGEKGTHHDIVFATGGFLEANEAMRLDNERNIFFVGGHAHAGLSDKIIDLNVNGNVTVGGEFYVSGNIIPSANVTYDLGNATHRFNDLYLAGTTINLGGTLIQAQANGEVSIGNATFSSSGTISAADVSLTVSALSANTVASLSDAGKMLTYDGISPITYGIPNNATTSFATGSRIELLALSQATIIVQPDGGSGVTLITSKDLNVNNPTISNIQSAKLTKIGTDTWYLGL